MSVPDPEMINSIGQAMVRSAPDGWQRITLEVHALANTAEVGFVVVLDDGSTTRKVRAEVGLAKLCDDLRKSMYDEGKGTWYMATFTVKETLQVTMDFDYENPPFGGVAADDDPDSGGDADPELLRMDQEMFPRAPENLPDWHPAGR